MQFSSIFGKSLVTKGGKVDTDEHLKGKVVGIYFSAHWCPPCRGFTPVLAKRYEAYKAAGKNFEIVFASSDRDQSSFDEYYGEMPWAAVPFDERQVKDKLSSKFKVQGIPMLVIIDSTGKLITKDGRSVVGQDETGADFPWKPKPIRELLGNEFLAADGKTKLDADAAIKGKVVGLYFSAHWCPPCRMFTPQLGKTYEKVKAAGKNFELIFASSDQDQKSFDEYFGTMPFLAIPFEDRKRKEALSQRFGVRGIPSLVLLDEDCNVITKDGRSALGPDPEGANFPWKPKALIDLAVGNPGPINDTPSLVALMENSTDETRSKVVAAMEPVANEYQAKAKAAGEDMEFCFFYANSDARGIPSKIRQMTKTSAKEEPTFLLIDISGQNYAVVESLSASITEADVRKTINDHKSGALKMTSLG